MENIFLHLLNMSIAASWLVLAVVLVRFAMKSAPKWIICLLWGMVGLRLAFPISMESALSLLPSAQPIPADIALSAQPALQSGIPAVNQVINPIITDTFRPEVGASVNPMQIVLFAATVLWLVGVAAVLLWGVISWVRLRRKVAVSVPVGDKLYCCDYIETPFILGVFKPKIYVPSGLSEEEVQYVALHERAHLTRRDHLWKPLGFLLLAIYWFNPLMWLAYILLCRDIERACDEKVVKSMDLNGKVGYSNALLACSIQRRLILACPLAFGELAVKDRVQAVLYYKKPAFWVIVGAVVTCLVVAVCFLTNPVPCEHTFYSTITLEATCTSEGVETFTCSECKYSYTEPMERLAHTYDDGKVTLEATCTAEGSKELTCTACGNVTTEVVAMAAHTFGDAFVTKEPNCTETGEASATCGVCQQTLVVETLAVNDVHDMKNEVIRAATCSDPGEGTNTCNRCGIQESCTYELLAHNYELGMDLKGTCRSEGTQEWKCSHCGDTYWKTTPKTEDHRWMDMGFTVQCIICGKTKSRSLSLLLNLQPYLQQYLQQHIIPED